MDHHMGQKFLAKLCLAQLLVAFIVILSFLSVASAPLDKDKEDKEALLPFLSHDPNLQWDTNNIQVHSVSFLQWDEASRYKAMVLDAVGWFAKTTGYAVIMLAAARCAARFTMKAIKRVRQREPRDVVKRLGPNPDVDIGLLYKPSKFLGEGGSGSTYVVMKQKKKWVMKRLNDVVVSKKEFQEKMEFIRGFGEHINVLALEAHYYSEYHKVVMYDYFEGGSLMSLLHGNNGGCGRTLLLWESRVKIALGAARGIAHIHALGFIHGNIKSSNVLINQKMEGVICDMGLVGLMSSQVHRSAGYQAPEVSRGGAHTQSSDVYSFGILLLELLSGRHPLQFPAREEMVDMTRMNWADGSRQQYDMQLRYPLQRVQEGMSKMQIIALDCICSPVVYRPAMEYLAKQLQDIKYMPCQSRWRGYLGMIKDGT